MAMLLIQKGKATKGWCESHKRLYKPREKCPECVARQRWEDAFYAQIKRYQSNRLAGMGVQEAVAHAHHG